jgi:hypothetical protein
MARVEEEEDYEEAAEVSGLRQENKLKDLRNFASEKQVIGRIKQEEYYEEEAQTIADMYEKEESSNFISLKHTKAEEIVLLL